MAQGGTLVAEVQTLTFTDVMTADEVITVAGVAYTFKAAVGATANEVLIGGDITASRDALLAAINDDTASQSLYGSATVVNPHVTGAASGTDKIVCTARVPGVHGTAYHFAEVGDSSWAETTAGSGSIDSFISGLISRNQINSEVLYELKKLTEAAD